jgi:hypothetical protein
MAAWNELPDDTAGPAIGPPGVAISVPATDFLGTHCQIPSSGAASGAPRERQNLGDSKSGDYSNFIAPGDL